jgi:hypothetical protein
VLDVNQTVGMVTLGEAGKNAIGIHGARLARAPDTRRWVRATLC